MTSDLGWPLTSRSDTLTDFLIKSKCQKYLDGNCSLDQEIIISKICRMLKSKRPQRNLFYKKYENIFIKICVDFFSFCTPDSKTAIFDVTLIILKSTFFSDNLIIFIKQAFVIFFYQFWFSELIKYSHIQIQINHSFPSTRSFDMDCQITEYLDYKALFEKESERRLLFLWCFYNSSLT